MASPCCPSVILCRVIIWGGDCPVHCMMFKSTLGLSPLDASSIHSVIITQKCLQTLDKITPQLRIIALHSFSAGFMSDCLVLFDQWLLMWKTLCTLDTECCVCSTAQALMWYKSPGDLVKNSSNSGNLGWILRPCILNKPQVMPLLLLFRLHFD